MSWTRIYRMLMVFGSGLSLLTGAISAAHHNWFQAIYFAVAALWSQREAE